MVSHTEHDEKKEIVRHIESFHVSDLPAESFLNAAVSLKDQVVDATWKKGSSRCVDPTAYSGLLGTALLCLRSYEATGNGEDLRLCTEIVDTCTVVAQSSCTRHVTFLSGEAGVFALGAVVANYSDDVARRDLYLDLFLELASDPALPVGPEEGGLGMPYELLHGRAGFLYASLFINKYLGPDTIPSEILDPVVEAILAGGRAGSSDNPDCPLMYRWHGTRYLGASHGLAGILHVLLHFQHNVDDLDCLLGSIKYMIGTRFGDSGNYPSNEGNPRDRLVQWSDGAGGVGIMLCKAAKVFSDDREIYEAAIEAGETVWKRGLNHKVGLSDGIAGNAYTFLSLYRLTNEGIYLERAKAFADFLLRNAAKLITCDESTHSLFQGLAGLACLCFDLVSPVDARFPGFEL